MTDLTTRTQTTAMAAARTRARRRGRWRLVAVLVLLVAAGAAWWYWQGRAQPDAAPVTVAVATGDVTDVVSALGSVQPRIYVDVGAQVSGQLDRLHVAIGDKVDAGQLLAEIDARVAQARLRVDSAELDRLNGLLDQQNAQRVLAVSQARRQRTMLAGNATSRDEVETAESQVSVLDAQIAQTRAQIAGQEATITQDRTNLSYTKISAPIAGTVVSLSAAEGQTLNANQSAPIILRIADLGTMTVQAQVSEADQPKLVPGMKVRFNTLGRPDAVRLAELRQIYPTPTIVNDVVLYSALFDVPNADGQLLPDMSAQVFFVRAEATDVPMVPLAALLPAARGEPADQRRVKVMAADGRIEERSVTIGVVDRVHAEIRSGLAPGEQVVLPSAAASGRRGGQRPGGPMGMGPPP